MSSPNPSLDIPTLTEVLIAGTPTAGSAVPNSTAAQDLLGPVPLDVAALEARLLEELVHRLGQSLEQRIHATVAPAVSLLADRIAYKAAQEVSADLAERMREDLQAAVRLAVDDALKGR